MKTLRTDREELVSAMMTHAWALAGLSARAKGFAKIVCLTLFLSLPCSAPAATTNDLTFLLQQGLFEEEANRDIEAAIASYDALAKQFDRNR